MNTTISRSIICLVGLAIVSLISPQAYAAVDSTAGNAGFQFLDIPPSPRQIAMGWTGTALGANGFAYYNPASPFIEQNTFLSVGYAPMPFDQSIAHAQGSCVISNFFVGANITNLVVNGIYPASFDHEPDYNTPFSYNGSLLSLNGGFMSDRFGIGVTMNGLQEQIGSATAYGISASIGLVLTVNNNLTAGAAALQFGSSTGFTDETRGWGQGYALPRSGRVGLAFCDTVIHVPYTLTGDMVYRDVGLRGTPLSQRFSRVSVPLGIEVRPTSYVAVRLGKRFNYDTELFTCGAGLSWSMISFDLAFAFKNYVSSFEADPFFSLTYTLGAHSRNIPKINVPAPAPSIIEKPDVNAPAPSDLHPSSKQATPTGGPRADTSAVGTKPPEQSVPSPSKVPNGSLQSAPEKAETGPARNSVDQPAAPYGLQADSARVVQPPAPVKQ